MTLELAEQQDFTSIQSTQILIRVMSKILASHMLQGNFATKKVTSLELKVNSVEPSTFLPQRNKVLVKQELLSEVRVASENVMDFTDSHKMKREDRDCLHWYYAIHGGLLQSLHQHGYYHHCHLFQ